LNRDHVMVAIILVATLLALALIAHFFPWLFPERP